MLRHSFRVGLRRSHFRMSQTRTLGTTTRSIHDDTSHSHGSRSLSSHHDASINNSNHIHPLIATLKSEMATKSELATLRSDVTTQIKSFSDRINGRFDSMQGQFDSMQGRFDGRFDSLTAEIKVLTSDFNAKINVLTSDFKAGFDKFRQETSERENKFWIRVVFGFAGTAIVAICASVMRIQYPIEQNDKAVGRPSV